jgi:hypothetical protein
VKRPAKFWATGPTRRPLRVGDRVRPDLLSRRPPMGTIEEVRSEARLVFVRWDDAPQHTVASSPHALVLLD